MIISVRIQLAIHKTHVYRYVDRIERATRSSEHKRSFIYTGSRPRRREREKRGAIGSRLSFRRHEARPRRRQHFDTRCLLWIFMAVYEYWRNYQGMFRTNARDRCWCANNSILPKKNIWIERLESQTGVRFRLFSDERESSLPPNAKRRGEKKSSENIRFTFSGVRCARANDLKHCSDFVVGDGNFAAFSIFKYSRASK